MKIHLVEWKFYEENHHKIQARQDKLIDFSRLFDKAENQYESFIPFSNSQVSHQLVLKWFLADFIPG